jgi:hypothetical protein
VILSLDGLCERAFRRTATQPYDWDSLPPYILLGEIVALYIEQGQLAEFKRK